ncbi:MAG: hypothetical protein QHH75_07905 [Bacillota bacterium]|nr:hypothetical protein [Bacillota bacterium]
MYRLVFIILTLVIVKGLFGCGFPFKNDIDLSDSKSSTNKLDVGNTVSDSSNYERDIIDLIKKYLERDFGADDLTIKEISNHDNSSFVIFLIKKGNTLYEGLAYIEKDHEFYKLNDIDIAEVDLNVPFTKHTLGVLLKDGRDCMIMGGYINNKNIKEIHIEYKNNTTNVIKIGKNQNTYMDYIIGQSDYVKEIIGFKENYEVIYSYN